MNVELEPGTYVVAVSGGVDSMVLLDLVVKQIVKNKEAKITSQQPTPNSLKLIVAHFDHGIRQESELDRIFVQEAANRYGLPFVFDQGHLGSIASEAKAREARYKFLLKVKSASGAKAVITAHHQDDAIETAIINILRGTNRRGLTSLQNHPDLLRPLLGISKSQLIDYAKAHGIKWREDASNKDTKYLRNHVRHNIMPCFNDQKRQEFIAYIDKLSQLNKDIDHTLSQHLHPDGIDRTWFVQLPHNIAREVIASWLRQTGVVGTSKKRLELLVIAAKTYKPGKRIDVDKQHALRVDKEKLALAAIER